MTAGDDRASGALEGASAEQQTAAAPAAGVPRQLVLAFGHPESFEREDFFPGIGNEAALAFIERWPDWPSRTLALVGPEGAGKSHLAAMWARAAGGRIISGHAIDVVAVPTALATGVLVVEDADRELRDQAALFHLLNLAAEQHAYVLFTARNVPAAWNIDLPDLASRLRALPVIFLAPPDDALLAALLVKLFADRQIAVDDILISYLLSHIERSFAAAQAAVAELDDAALRLKRPVSRTLAAQILHERSLDDNATAKIIS